MNVFLSSSTNCLTQNEIMAAHSNACHHLAKHADAVREGKFSVNCGSLQMASANVITRIEWCDAQQDAVAIVRADDGSTYEA